MKKTVLLMATLVSCLVLVMPPPVAAAKSSATRHTVGRVMHYFGRKFGRETVEEGGKVAVKKSVAKVLARSGKRHGDHLPRLFKRLGPRSVRMVDSYGNDAVKILSRWGDDGLRLLSRSADDVLPLFRRYGDSAIEVCIKHPGVGKRLIREMGEDGIRIGRSLNTDQVIRLLRASPRLARKGKLQEAGRAASRHGTGILDFIENHKALTLGVPAFFYVVHNPEVLQPAGAAVGEAAGKGFGGAAGGLAEGVGKALVPEREDRLSAKLVLGVVLGALLGWRILLTHRRKLVLARAKVGKNQSRGKIR